MLPTTIRRRQDSGAPSLPIGRALDRFVRDWLGDDAGEGTYLAAYPVDIREDDDTIHVDAELPGFGRDEIDVSVDNGVLRITAQRQPTEAQGTEHLNERRYTRVDRAFTLPAHVQEDQINAHLADGVLHVSMPKAEQSRKRRIEIS